MTPADEATMTLTVRLPKDLYEQLRKQAFDQRTSMNALIIEALRQRA
jgi:predicted HicB family RNase H-like nuclease